MSQTQNAEEGAPKPFLMHTDATPSESFGGLSDGDALSLVALSFTDLGEEPLPIGQYTRKARRIRDSEKLVEAIENGYKFREAGQEPPEPYLLDLRVAAAITTKKTAVDLGNELVGKLDRQATELVAESWRAPFAWYAQALSVLSLCLAAYCRGHYGAWPERYSKEACFALDPLPGDTPGTREVGLEFMKSVARIGDVAKYFEASRTKHGLSKIGFGYVSSDNPDVSVKDSQHPVLADWFSHCAMAWAGLGTYAGMEERDRAAVAAPLAALEKRKHARVIDMRGLVLGP